MNITREGKHFVLQDFNPNDLQHYPELVELGFELIPVKRKVCAPYSEYLLIEIVKLTDNPDFYDMVLDPSVMCFLTPANMYADVEPLKLPSLREPRSHQLIGNRLLLERPRWMLGWEAGSGKSKPVVDTYTYLIENGVVDHVLIITDASVIDTWVNKHIPKDTDKYIGVALHGTAGERRTKLRVALRDPKVRFFVVNYEGFRVLKDEITDLLTPNSAIILDESQRVKDIGTTRFKGVYKAARHKGVKRIHELSGTPVTQKPEDAFGQFAIMDESVYGGPKSWYAFQATYVIKNPRNKHHTIGYRNMDRFMRKLHSRVHRVRKEDVLDLPPITYETIEFDLPIKLRRLYDDFIDSGGLLVDPETQRTVYVAENRLAVMSKAQTLTKGWVYDNWNENNNVDEHVNPESVHWFFPGITDPRLEWLRTFLLDTGAPTIVFFPHRADKKIIHEIFDKENIPYVSIDGSVPTSARAPLIEQFEHGKVDVICGHPAAMGTGVDGLQERARYVVYLGNIWSVEKRIQSEARAYRDGVKNPIGVYDLLYSATVDITIYNHLMNRREFSRQLVDGGEDEFKRFMKGEVWV